MQILIETDENTTNGDILKSIFPEVPKGVSLDVCLGKFPSAPDRMTFKTDTDWWNAPYRKE